MNRKVFSVVTLLSVFIFPWPLTGALAIGTAVFEPFLPFAAGILIDVLYIGGHAAALPVFTIIGGVLSILAWFVRGRLKTGIIRE